MEPAISSEEDLVCQTCGDKGFTNAFVYCVKCLKYVIHRYCLAVIPKTNDEFVKWYCEGCKPSPPYKFTSPPRNDPSLNKTKIDSFQTEEEDNERVTGPTKRSLRRVVLGLKRRERKHLQIQEKVSASLQNVKTVENKKLLNTNQEKEKEIVSEEITLSDSLQKDSDSGANKIIPEFAELDKCFSIKGIVKKKRDTIRVAAKRMMRETEKLTEHSPCESSCTDVTSKNEERVKSVLDDDDDNDDDEKLVYISSSTDDELNKMNEVVNGRVYVSESSFLENNMQYAYEQHARPVPDPIWRGSFQITPKDYGLFEGLVGHLSTKACYKVYQEANILPSMLSLEMHSKAHLWPKSFMDSMPSDYNIALYFFPGEREIEKDYEQLVNVMINDDLAMKATTKNAVLLIFTSKVLPQANRRFNENSNYYLWGVFRSKKNDDAVSNHSDKEIIKPVKPVESHSPQSPLCNYR